VGQFEAFVGVNFWTALFILLNTLVIFFVAKKFLFGPVMKIIESRQQEIDDMYTQAESAKGAAEKLQSEYEEKLSQAAATSERLVKEATVRAQSREEEIIREANQRAEAIRTKASADIAQEKKKALNDAKDEISVIALAIAGKVVGRSLTEADQAKLVEQFIDELGDEA
jgi:F-type H+-transporting ATPase subunit b